MRQLILYALLVAFFLPPTYFLAVLADRYFVYASDLTAATYQMHRAKEAFRRATRDLKERRLALADGYEPIFYPDLLEYDSRLRELANEYGVAPLAPQPNTDVYYCNEGYGLVRYRTDEFGFRNEKAVWGLPESTLLIGDSYVQGACVDDASSITGVLSVHRRVINAGTASNNPIHYGALAKVLVPRFKPRNVVMVFYANDNMELAGAPKESFYFSRYWSDTSPDYFSDSAKTPSLTRSMQDFYVAARAVLLEKVRVASEAASASAPEKPAFFELSSKEMRQLAARENPFWRGLNSQNLRLKSLWSITKSMVKGGDKALEFGSRLAVDALAQECAARCNGVIAFIPNSTSWRPDGRAPGYKRALRSYAASRSLAFVDLTRLLSEFPEGDVYARLGPHLSPFGYSLVADELEKHLN